MKAKQILYTGDVVAFIQQPDFVRGTCNNVISLKIISKQEGETKTAWTDDEPIDFDYTTNGESNSSLDSIIRTGDHIKIMISIEQDYLGRPVHKVTHLKNFTKHKNFREL